MTGRGGDQPRIGSLCSGYGGLDMGLMAVVGGSVAWHVEYDKAPSKILAHHWPDVPNYGDITTTDWTRVEPVDWLTAGYPCQPFSHAGKRKGTTDERHIWPHVAAAIGALRPGHVLLENVAGHLTLGFADVLADLATLGYDATWGLVRAADAGAPHGRARLFVVAHAAGEPGSERHGDDVRARRGTDGRRTTTGGSAAPDSRRERYGRGQDGREVGRLDRDDESEARKRERSRPVAGDRSATAPADTDDGGSRNGCAGTDGRREPVHSVRDGAVPDTASDGRHEGWPEPARIIRGSDAAERSDAPADAHDPNGWRSNPQRGSFGRDAAASSSESRIEWGAYEPAIRRWEAVTGRPAPSPTEPGRTGQRLSPRFVEWMQGLPAGHVTDVDIPRNAQLKALGNGVVPQQAALALRTLLPLSEVAA